MRSNTHLLADAIRRLPRRSYVPEIGPSAGWLCPHAFFGARVLTRPLRRLVKPPGDAIEWRGLRLPDWHTRRSAHAQALAAVELGWERYIGLEGRFIGMHSFGASGKIADVYKKFDINAEAVVRAAHETLAEVATL
jgi:hypothetical protein